MVSYRIQKLNKEIENMSEEMTNIAEKIHVNKGE